MHYLRLAHDSSRAGQDSVYHALEGAMERGDVRVRACYCSVLDECWVRTEENPDPAPVRSCDEERRAPQYR